MSPNTPEFTETSMPMEPPPPIPKDQFPGGRSRDQPAAEPVPEEEEEEEQSEEVQRQNFLKRIGATSPFMHPMPPMPPTKPLKRPPTAPKPT